MSSINPEENFSAPNKAGRAAAAGVEVAMKGIGGNLALASTVTVSLLFGMVFVLLLGLFLIMESENPGFGLALAVVATVIVNTVVFFLSPFLMDLTQRWLYGTRWVGLEDIRRRSPESAQVIEQVCRERQLKHPRLGIIDDQNPTAFTYGSLPDTARLVVSQGLFTYLDDDETATVYAHELGTHRPLGLRPNDSSGDPRANHVPNLCFRAADVSGRG